MDIRSASIRASTRRSSTATFTSIARRISRDGPSSRKNARRWSKPNRIVHVREESRRKHRDAARVDMKMTTSKSRKNDLCGLRISAPTALKIILNVEGTEIRRDRKGKWRNV